MWQVIALLLLVAVAPAYLASTSVVRPPTSARPVFGSTPAQLAGNVPVLQGRVVAVGIAGAGAISAVGRFHPGGPIHDKPEFAAFTAPGRVLDANRIVIASTSNYGAPRAQADQPAGAILSVDPRGTDVLVVPPTFAAAGDQATALDGRVQLFTAQSPAFVNRTYNPDAVTAALPPVSNPLAISINNAFGRLWFANAPEGGPRSGTESVVDPDGRPLAEAPSQVAGGVFASVHTNRAAQYVPGALDAGVVGTAFLGHSPDGSGRAVFAAANADGSIVQIHVVDGVDGVAPAGTIGALADVSPQVALSTQPVPTRAGMVFNWVPDTIVFVADPLGNAVVALTLVDDGQIFRVEKTRRIAVPELDLPVDLAPVVPEVVNPGFASNTTLAGGSDLYVLNRGNGTIVRLRQDGAVAAVRQVEVPGLGAVGPGRLSGIAVAPDAQRIWVTLSGALPDAPNAPGVVVELPAFGTATALDGQEDRAADTAALVARGEALFRADFTPEAGLGPLFNEQSCVACHNSPSVGGMGGDGLAVVLRVGRLTPAGFDPLRERGGPVGRAHSVTELGFSCWREPGIPAPANLTSTRNAPVLFGLGLVDTIPDDVILAQAIARGDGIQGRPNLVRGPDGRERVGRFGWKAEIPTLEDFVGDAFRNELGITNPLAPTDHLADAPADAVRCAGESEALEDDGTAVRAVTAFVASLAPPAPPAGGREPAGQAVFERVGCAACHVPSLRGPGGDVPLYSDLLLHDVGPVLDDGVPQGVATGRDWRTTPLWGLGARTRLLHDGRARTVQAAIQAHGGEAAPVIERFRALSPEERAQLLAFLASL